jgi:hypothetical protein
MNLSRASAVPDLSCVIAAISSFLAFGLGLLLPTYVLIAPVVDQIQHANVSTGAALAALVVFVVTASAGVLTPLIIFAARRTWAESMLGAWREWLVANSSLVVAVLLLALGALFLARSITSGF